MKKNIYKSLLNTTKVLVSVARKQKPLFFWCLILLTTGVANNTFAQSDTIAKEEPVKIELPATDTLNNLGADTTTVEEVHSPRKATYLAMALPGLGQAYNKKYWKIPIIYAGFGTLGYFIHTNNQEYKKFKAAYTYVKDELEGDPPNDMVERYDSDETKLKSIKDYYRRNLELSYILTGALYILQVLDATVDAHFVNYDVSEDLSLQISPKIEPDPFYPIHPSPGLAITLKFRK